MVGEAVCQKKRKRNLIFLFQPITEKLDTQMHLVDILHQVCSGEPSFGRSGNIGRECEAYLDFNPFRSI
ncbi:hypothetical protein D3C71_1690660 [compost metagenome]